MDIIGMWDPGNAKQVFTVLLILVSITNSMVIESEREKNQTCLPFHRVFDHSGFATISEPCSADNSFSASFLAHVSSRLSGAAFKPTARKTVDNPSVKYL